MSPTIICEECERPESEEQHDRKNWGRSFPGLPDGHQFVAKPAPAKSSNPVRKMTPAEKAAAPVVPVAAADGPPCVDCGKAKRLHRGPHIGHRYHAPGAPPPKPSKAQLRAAKQRPSNSVDGAKRNYQVEYTRRKARHGGVPTRRTNRRASTPPDPSAKLTILRDIVAIAEQIDELQKSLDSKMTELKELFV